MTDDDGHRLEAAEQFGFKCSDDTPNAFADWSHSATEAQIIAFAKACEMKGRREAMKFIRAELNNPLSARDKSPLKAILGALTKLNDATTAENAPILEAAEVSLMTSQGYVRGTTGEPGKRWVKPVALCEDEGCPHHGIDHVCVNLVRV